MVSGQAFPAGVINTIFSLYDNHQHTISKQILLQTRLLVKL
jgi:hypothetical protein